MKLPDLVGWSFGVALVDVCKPAQYTSFWEQAAYCARDKGCVSVHGAWTVVVVSVGVQPAARVTVCVWGDLGERCWHLALVR
jgi:hypothetical protein